MLIRQTRSVCSPRNWKQISKPAVAVEKNLLPQSLNPKISAQMEHPRSKILGAVAGCQKSIPHQAMTDAAKRIQNILSSIHLSRQKPLMWKKI
jgi:hypothetical protein